jgi:hypothetical protein
MKIRTLLLALLCLGLLPGVTEAGRRGPGTASGVGSNPHRSFIIKRDLRSAVQGRPTPRHYGVYVSGGYPGRR